MPVRRSRAFTIRDVMILVAATAFGIVLARALFADALRFRLALAFVSRPVTFFLLAWTIAFIPIRLHRPRPSIRRLMHQPGWVACCAVAVVTVIDAAAWAVPKMIRGGNPSELSLDQILAGYWRVNSGHIGPAVVVAWLGMFLSHRWRPEAGWIDRSGRVIGVLWILTSLCDGRFAPWTFKLTHGLMAGFP